MTAGNSCAHLHISGRPCNRWMPKQLQYCAKHTGDKCEDCEGMMAVFKPRKGWKR